MVWHRTRENERPTVSSSSHALQGSLRPFIHGGTSVSWKCVLHFSTIFAFVPSSSLVLTLKQPFYDMMNHHNGKYNTAHKYNPYVTLDDSEIKPIGYEIVTTKKITKSEEIYNSYNRCNICHEYFDHVGTPEIFNMFGFVEFMPQRWLFDFARVKFDLDWRDADESTGDAVVSFLVPPSERGIALLQEELDRLSLFAAHRDDDPKDAGIPASEWQSLWQYYDALHYAVSCAVQQSSKGNMTDDVWKLDENWWVHNGTLTADDDEDHGVYPTINA